MSVNDQASLPADYLPETLFQVASILDQALPQVKVESPGPENSLSAEQFDSLLASW